MGAGAWHGIQIRYSGTGAGAAAGSGGAGRKVCIWGVEICGHWALLSGIWIWSGNMGYTDEW